MTFRLRKPPRVPSPPAGIGQWMRWVEDVFSTIDRANSGVIAVTGKDVAAGSISQGALEQGALDSFLITSPQIQSSEAASGLPRWTGDYNGVHFYDGDGNTTMDFDAPTGRALITGKTQTAPDGIYPRAELDDQPPTNDPDGYTRQITGMKFFTGDGEAVPFVGIERASGIGDPTSDFIIRYADPLTGTTGQIAVDGNGVSVSGNLTVTGNAPGAVTGMMMLWTGGAGSIPAGWLRVNGNPASRTVYANLFAAIGTSYGVGDGSTTFNVPTATPPAATMFYIIKT